MIHENYFGMSITKMYNDAALRSTESHDVSKWGSKQTQVTNFKEVSAILENYPEVKSILDVGSGLGDIRGYLPTTIGEYTGIDIANEVVKKANDPDITEADVKTYQPNRKFDAVVALGSFNIGVSFADVKAALAAMYKLANIITIVTISYITEEELEELRNEGWNITTHPYAFFDGYADRHTLTRISYEQDSKEIARLEEILNQEREWRNQ